MKKSRVFLGLTSLALLGSLAAGAPQAERERDTRVYSPRPMHKDTPGVPFTLIDNKKVRKGAGRRLSRAQRKKLYGKRP